jgi:hypothetical protein
MRYVSTLLWLFWLALVLSSCSRQDGNGEGDRGPGVKRVGERAVVFGCDGELDWNAKGACPWICCEAAVLNSREVDLMDEVKLWGGPISEDGSRQLVVGTARSLRPNARTQRYVQCLIQGDKIARVGVITERQYNAVRYNNEWL